MSLSCKNKVNLKFAALISKMFHINVMGYYLSHGITVNHIVFGHLHPYTSTSWWCVSVLKLTNFVNVEKILK